jgi:hypothetical protein
MVRVALAATVIATLGLAACETAPTPYQPAGASAPGYSEMRIENNRYRISFKGNSSTGRDTVETYMLYRAAELTLQSGYDTFTVAHRETDRDVSLRSYGGYYGGYAGFPYYPYHGWGWGNPYWGAWGGPSYRTSTSYEGRIEILMGRGPSGDDPNTFDAREVTQNLAGAIQRTPQTAG